MLTDPAISLGHSFYIGYQHPVACQENISGGNFTDAPSLRLIIADSGSAVAKLNQTRNIISAPTVFCLNENDSLVFENDENLLVSSVYFHPNLLNSRFNYQNIRTGSAEFSQTDWQDRFSLAPFLDRSIRYIGYLEPGLAYYRHLKSIFCRLKNEIHSQPDGYWPCRSRSYFLELLFLFQNFTPGQDQLNTTPLALQKHPMDDVMLYLNTHYDTRISIPGLAARFHTNRTTLMRQFHDYTGKTINRYLTDLRIRMAAQMLRDTNIQITEVLDRTGFKDITHFGRTFRRLTGETPTSYREKNSWVIRKF